MPASPLKRPSAGGRLGRLLASLRQPARAGPLPVQTGFPTSLADLVVKNHVRLKNPRRRHRSSTAAPSPTPTVAVAASEPPPSQQQRRELSGARPEGAGFSIRPELLAVGGAVALALLAVWSKWLVAVATVASVTLFWIESVRSPASRRRPRPETTEPDLGSRGLVSPIREAETPRSNCAESDRGSEVSSLWAADDSINPNSPKRKEKRRSLRKLIAKKLRSGKGSKDKDSPDARSRDGGGGGESKHPDAGAAGVSAEPVKKTEALPAPAEPTTAPEAITGERRRRGGAFPSAAFVPIILAGLVAGKLPAVALAVLCAVFFSSVERVPATS